MRGRRVLEDGVYTAEFDTDSSMFHVNEANDGQGCADGKDGKMTIHVAPQRKRLLNLLPEPPRMQKGRSRAS